MSNFVEEQFKWRTRDGKFIPIRDMESRHLFYTLRMIWNHAVPEELKLRPYKEYTFCSFYTEEYVKRAVVLIHCELIRRDDLRPHFLRQLQTMCSRMHEYLGTSYQLKKEISDGKGNYGDL